MNKDLTGWLSQSHYPNPHGVKEDVAMAMAVFCLTECTWILLT
jgi:hypothetical protein